MSASRAHQIGGGTNEVLVQSQQELFDIEQQLQFESPQENLNNNKENSDNNKQLMSRSRAGFSSRQQQASINRSMSMRQSATQRTRRGMEGRGTATPLASLIQSKTSVRPSSALPAVEGRDTPLGGNPRTVSSCSTNASLTSGTSCSSRPQTTETSSGSPLSLSQCRICRKLIQANETYHLCSTCNQFVCDDCASYSANDKHETKNWMCSSCRRRITKPAIPADTLKELGLNQNSSAVRRMTLRLNKTELQMATNKANSSNESTSTSTSSTSTSSGCSSMQLPSQQLQQQQRRQLVNNNNNNNNQLSTTTNRTNPANNSSDNQAQQSIQQQTNQTQQAQQTNAQLQAQKLKQQSTRDTRSASVTRLPLKQQQSIIGSKEPLLISAATNMNRQVLGTNVSSQSSQAASGVGNAATRPSYSDSNFTNSSQQQRQDDATHTKKRSAVQEAIQSGTMGGAGRVHSQKGLGLERKATVASLARFEPQLWRTASTLNQGGLGRGGVPISLQQQQQQQQQQRPPQAAAGASGRRFSLALGGAGGLSGAESILAGGLQFINQRSGAPLNRGRPASLRNHDIRKQSAAGATSFMQMQNLRYEFQQAQAQATTTAAAVPQQEQYYVGGSMENSRIVNNQQQQQQQIQYATTPIQPQTLVTASSDLSVNNAGMQDILHRTSIVHPTLSGPQTQLLQQQQLQPQQQYSTLIPIPPEQMYLRRLSDQSNLVRRSSIIADTIGEGLSVPRNRSHSNIDTMDYSSLFYQPTSNFIEQQQQQQQDYMDYSYDNIDSSSLQKQNRKQSGPNSQQIYSHEYHSQTQPQQSNKSLSSIITPYSQKQRRSSEEMRSDSSSDIEEDTRVCQASFEFDNDQPNDYFAPPRPLATTAHISTELNMDHFDRDNNNNNNNNNNNIMLATANDQPPIAIPSVSVSEFRSSQQRLHQLQQKQEQQRFGPIDQIMTTPMQINNAIEQAIKQQQQQNQNAHHRLSMASDFLFLDATGGQTRRGSSGRVLPRLPGEQSRSLLELPRNNGTIGGSDYDQAPGEAGFIVDQQLNTLGLPLLSPTIRRASAPEGQNIKIVVDDIDGRGGSMGVNKQNRRPVYGKHGELYERLVLYRDDSLDPNTNMPRGFGLHVAGGKIDDEEDKLQAYVTWTLPGGPADKMGIKRGDRIVEWDGKCLFDMSYEQVAEVIESSANMAELLIKPAVKLEPQPGDNFVRSQRRMSQQTERDLKKIIKDHQPLLNIASNGISGLIAPPGGGATTCKNGYNSGAGHIGHNQFDNTIMGGESQQLHQFTSISTGNSPRRSGTGRRLPQIPDLIMPGGRNCASNDQSSLATPELKQNSSSAGQLGSGESGRLGIMSGVAHELTMQNGASLNALDYAGRNNQVANRGYSNYGASSGTQYQNNNNNNNQHLQLHQQPHSHSLSAPSNEIWGLIGLQVSVDERMAQLEISILSVINRKIDPNFDYYVQVKILPESNRFKAFKTAPSSDLSWKETFLFQNFPIQQIQRMALEIGIWVYDEAPRLSTQIVQPVCEAMIPIQSARERNTDFWPLRAQPTSPQSRRKSLNDLLEILSRQDKTIPNEKLVSGQLSAGYRDPKTMNHWAPQLDQRQLMPKMHGSTLPIGDIDSQAHDNSKYSPSNIQQLQNLHFHRERSASNRNLPDTNKLKVQPRRASDEVASSSSQRLMTRTCQDSGRRSISVMNVGDGFSRPSSRLGSQSNILKMRRESNQQLQQSANQSPVGAGSPITKHTPQTETITREANSEMSPQQIGITPSGRRSSLVGIQSMTGYRSQKNSASDNTSGELKSPSKGPSQKQRSQVGTPQHSNQLGATMSNEPKPRGHQHQARTAPVSASPSQVPLVSSGANSRRGSTDHGTPILQRKGSFAMLTLRKLKRTMSLTKGDQDQGSNQGSRQSSASSEESVVDVPEDLGVTRRILSYTDFVGKLKLSFIMTKGQLEVDVICARGLKVNSESSLGVYVKMYLKGKNKSNKRKTRLVQSWESPIFKQLIKYDGSLVDNKSLEVSVWQKLGGLRGKIPIGFTDIRLSELSLGQLQISWYNLRSMDSTHESSSIEDN